MILSELRAEKDSRSRTAGQFLLFKPLLLVALSICFFEVLPIDFKHAIAPQLIPYSEVFKADMRRPENSLILYESLSINELNANVFPPDPAEVALKD